MFRKLSRQVYAGVASKRMLRYYQKALKELEKSSVKHEAVGEVEEPHYEQVVNGRTSVNNRKRKKSDQPETGTHLTKRDRELSLKKKEKSMKSKEDWKVIEAANRHDNVNANEVRKTKKKKKKKKKKEKIKRLEFDAGNSNGRERFTRQFIESGIDPPIVSDNKEKKRKRECLTELPERTIKKGKKSAKTSKSQKRRDRETCDEIQESNFSSNGRTENLHTSNSVESSNLIQTTSTFTSSFETSPGNSPQSSTHVYKKSSHSGKESAKENQKRKTRKEKTKDQKSAKPSSTDNILNSNDNGTEVVRERAEPTLKMDEAKLREAVKISNRIHETWTLSKEKLQALAEEGK